MASGLTEVGFSWPSWAEFFNALTLRAGFNARVVTLGTTLLGSASGLLGTFILLRKKALVSDALSHACLPGLVAAFLIANGFGFSGKSLSWLLAGAAFSSLLAVLFIQLVIRFSRLKDDAAIAVVLSVSFGLGIALMSVAQSVSSGNQGGLAHFIYGQTAAMQFHDALVMGGVTLFAAVVLGLLSKELCLVAFDEDFARLQGKPIAVLDFFLLGLTVLVTVVGLQAVGLILMIALLVIPAAAARFWTERLKIMVWISLGFGAVSGYLGSIASALLPRFPAGSVIVLVSGVLFLLSFLFAPKRGWIAAMVQNFRTRLFITQDHILRGFFEEMEFNADLKTLKMHTFFKHATRLDRVCLYLLQWRGQVRRELDAWSLTDAGTAQAKRLTRNHRLWEEFLIHYADLAASHVDRSADMVEHSLSPDVVEILEKALAEKDQAQAALASEVPGSVHPLGEKKSEQGPSHG